MANIISFIRWINNIKNIFKFPRDRIYGIEEKIEENKKSDMERYRIEIEKKRVYKITTITIKKL
jgi:hypothetical protein